MAKGLQKFRLFKAYKIKNEGINKCLQIKTVMGNRCLNLRHSKTMDTKSIPAKTYTGLPTQKILLWISMASMVMIFAGLTSAYLVRQAEGNWTVFSLPVAFYVSTGLIVLSSFSMHYALQSVKKGNTEHLLYGLLVTLGLGLGFCFTQFLGWAKLVEMGIFFTGNPSGSFLYVITALHVAHLIGGIISLIVVIVRTLQSRYSEQNYLPISLISIYWHFLDVLWVYLFVFLVLIR
jgi:cytochrome c oxidase subunit 3